jgi:multidrug resistance efflux pump
MEKAMKKYLRLKHSILVLIPLLLLIAGSSCDILLENTGEVAGELEASGVVEAIEVIIASEVGGRIIKINASEGQEILTGDILFEIEDKMLSSQFNQAEAALKIAQANYELIVAGLKSEQKKAAIASAELILVKARYDFDNLYKDTDLIAAQSLQLAEELEKELQNLQNPELQQALALKAIADAQKTVESAERRLRTVSSAADESDIAAAEAQVVLAKDALDDAKEDFEPYENKPEDNLQRANYQSKLAAAQQVYDAAVRQLNALKGTGSEADIAVAEADLATAVAAKTEAEREWERIKDGPKASDITLLKAQIAQAREDYEIYKDGPDPADVILAQAQIKNAEAQLELASAEFPTQEEINVAQAQVDSAKAILDGIKVQLEMLKVKSPIDGIVLIRSIEEGELIQPGLSAITLGQLDKLTITVYIPEDKYGLINLGDSARLTSDSFPGEFFNATVIRIADQAEYTPRNIQTKEDRVTTVYAIDLSVDPSSGKLKPGMPTDVFFNQ